MASVSWKVNADGDWQDTGVWSTATPTASSDVILATAAAHAITHNSGTDSIHNLTVARDTLTINAGSLVIAGALAVAATGGLVVAGGTLSLAASGSDAGVLSLTGGQLILAKGVTLTASGASSLGGTIDGPGTLTTSGTTTLSYYTVMGGGLAWNNTGSVNTGLNGYSISLGDITGGTASISNAAGATFAFTSDATIQNNGYYDATSNYHTGSSTFANAGTLTKTAGTGTSQIFSAISNTGTITATSGYLELDGGGALGGTLGATGTGALVIGRGSYTLAGATQAISGQLNLNGGSIAIAAGKTLALSGTDYLVGTTIDGPGTLTTSGTTTLSYYTVMGGGLSWNNTGSVNTGLNAYSISLGDITGSTASISNAAGATFAFTSDATIQNNGYYDATSSYRTGSSTFANAGTLTKTAGTGTSYVYSALTSTGTIAVGSGTLEFDGGGTLSGSVGTTASGTLAFGAGSFTVAGVTKGSSLVVDGGSVTLGAIASSSLVVSSGTLALTGSSTAGVLSLSGGKITIAKGLSLAISGAVALSGTINLAAGASLTASGASSINNTIDGPGKLTTSGTTTLGTSYYTFLGGGLIWNNTGSVNTGSNAYSIYVGDITGGTAAISNAVSASFAFTSDAGIQNNGYYDAASTYQTGSSTFANAGTLSKSGGTGTSYVYSALTSTGTITASSGTLEFDGGGKLSGSVGTTASGTLAFGAGSFTVAGVVDGSSLLVDGGTVSLGATASSSLVVSSGALSLTGSGSAGVLSLTGGKIVLAKNLSLAISGAATLSGTIDLAAGTSLTAAGASSINSTIDGPGTLTTSGTVTLGTNYYTFLGGGLVWNNTGSVNTGINAYSIYVGDITGGTAAISNAAGANFAFTSDAGIMNQGYYDASSNYHTGSSTFANAGTLSKTAGTGTSQIFSAITNTGTITATSGTLELDGGGVLGGTLGATGAGVLALDGGNYTLASATQLVSGTLNLDGGTISLAAGQTLTLSGKDYLTGTIDGPGTLATSGITTLTTNASTYLGGGLAWSNTGAFNTGVNASSIYVGDIIGGTAAITNAAGAMFAFTSDSDILNQGYTDAKGSAQTGSSTFANAGTLSKTGGTGTSQMFSALVSTGTITAGSGTLELDGGAVLNGSVGSTSGVVLLAANGFATTTTLSVANSTTATALVLASGQTWTNSGGITLGARVQIGNVANSGTATLVNQAGATITLATDAGNIGTSGNALISNAGSIAKTGGTGTSTLSPNVTNTGTLDAASGTLKVNSVSGTGTLRIEAGAVLELNSFASTQAIVFAGAGATLKLDQAASVSQAMTGFGAGSRIDMAALKTAIASVSGSTLTVTAASKTYTFKSTVSLAGDVVVAGVDASGGGTVFTLFHQATPSLHTPEPVAFGSHHVGDPAVTQAIAITNTGVAGGYSEKLDATLSGATGDIAAAGTVTGLAGQATDSSSMVVTLNTATAGAKSGTATIAFVSDGTGIDGQGTTTLASQSVTASGAVYALAAPSFSGTAIAFGAARVAAGGTLAATGITLANGTAATAYQESLRYTASTGVVAFSPAAAGPQTLLAGSSASVGFVLSTATAGDFTGSAATVSLVSTGAGTSLLADTALGSQAITLNGKIYATAVAQVGKVAIDFGITHVSATAISQSLAVSNSASGALVDLLTGGSLAGAASGTLGFTVGGLAAGIAAGQAGALSVYENASQAGSFSGSAVLGFTSHDGDLADIAANNINVTTTGIVDNYAVAQFEAVSGGTLAGSGAALTLNLGSVAAGGTALSAQLGVLNGAAGLADLLGGSFVVSGASAFANTGFTAFSSLAAGSGVTGDVVTLSAATAGVFTETLLLHSAGSNASGYSGALADQKVTITGTIVATGQSYALTTAPATITGTTGNDIFTAAANALNSRDRIDGSTGVNTLQLTGAGSFDLGAPKTLANIQVANVSESVAGTIVYLRDGLNLALNVASGPAGAGVTVYGGADSSTINLGTGSDTVVLGSATEAVTANASGGVGLVQGTAALAGALVSGTAAAVTTLELSGGGTATLNNADASLRVVLDQATNLALGKGSFLAAIGSSGADTITAGSAGQTLTGGGGGDTLVGAAAFGDSFRDSTAHFNQATIKGFGGSDLIDVTDLAFGTLPTLKLATAGSGTTATATLGAGSLSLKLAGSYKLANFVAASDGHGGTQFSFH